MNTQQLEALYLEYTNDYLTVSAFAEAHGFTEGKALNILKLGKAINHKRG